jgi:hypothetical membrane protein
MERRLLASGVVASALYVAIDLVAALAFPDYHSFTRRVVSELMATGAPTERLVDPLFLLYGALMLVFAWAVWSVSARRRVRALAVVLGLYGAFGLLGPTVFEMDLRREDGALSPADLRHIAATVILVVIIFVAVALGAGVLGRRFRWFSYATIVVMLVFGSLSAALATSAWVGLVERINIGAFLAWVVVLAVGLKAQGLRVEPQSGQPVRTQ